MRHSYVIDVCYAKLIESQGDELFAALTLNECFDPRKERC